MHLVRGSHKFRGLSNLAVCIVPPILHNTKGGASRLLVSLDLLYQLRRTMSCYR